jgi:F-type H+-transporting ATPase subunit delta
MVAGVAGRYATALFELARDENQLDQVAVSMDRFVGLLNDSPDLQRMVRSPAISADDKRRALGSILEATDIRGISANFLNLVARNNRLFVVRDMAKAFNSLVNAHRGLASAEVTSAHPLSDAHKAALSAALDASLGQKVSLDCKVDPHILGGLIVKVGSRMIDSSLRTKLNNLHVAMKEVS